MPPVEENPPPRYAHFILLFWEERQIAAGTTTWRLSLENPRTGQRVGFQTLEELTGFLGRWMNHPDVDDESQPFMDQK